MQWCDEGIIISTRRHGENSVIVDLLTREHGRHSGMVRGGRSKRYRPVLQLGNRVGADWRGRLSEHLGMYVLEPLQLRAALIMSDALKLLALQSVCTLAGLIAERERHPGLFEATELMIAALVEQQEPGRGEAVPHWQSLLVVWELGLLAELGYGLDLSSCAATGGKKDLAYVSPKSSRAVSRIAGEPYHNRLLPLPAFLVGNDLANISIEEVRSGLKLTGYFLQKYLLETGEQELPDTRNRLYSKI